MIASIKHLLNKDIVITYMANAFAFVSGFVSIYTITNYINVEIYGIFVIIATTSGILISLVSTRTSEAIVVFVKEEMVKGNKESIKFILFIGFFIDLFIGIVFLILFYLLSSFIAETFIKDINYNFEVWIYSFITLFTYIKGVPYGLLQAREQFIVINIFTILEHLLKVTGLIFIVLFFNSIELLDIIYMQIVVSIIILLFYYYYSLKIYFKEYLNTPFMENKELLKKYWSFNLKTFTSSLLKAGNQKLDTLILGYFIDPKTVGVYAIIKNIVASPLALLASPFDMLYYSKLVVLYSKNKFQQFQQLIYKTTIILIIISFLYYALIFILGDKVIFYFNIPITIDEFNLYMSMLFFFSMPFNWWARIFSNTVNPIYSLYVNLLQTFTTIVITSLLTYSYGFIGLLYGLVFMKTYSILIWYYLLKNKLTKEK